MFKKRIGITQRVMRHPCYDEVMDCLDTNWTKLLAPIGILPIPLPLMPPSSTAAMWEKLALEGLILSGGNSVVDFADPNDDPKTLSPERDAFEKTLLDSAIATQTPVLGVCRGLQMINLYYGGQLIKIKGHAGTRHALIPDANGGALAFPSEVNSFHNYAVPGAGLGQNLVSLAHDAEGNIEALGHNHHKVLAMMWHPERETPSSQSDFHWIKEHFAL